MLQHLKTNAQGQYLLVPFDEDTPDHETSKRSHQPKEKHAMGLDEDLLFTHEDDCETKLVFDRDAPAVLYATEAFIWPILIEAFMQGYKAKTAKNREQFFIQNAGLLPAAAKRFRRLSKGLLRIITQVSSQYKATPYEIMVKNVKRTSRNSEKRIRLFDQVESRFLTSFHDKYWIKDLPPLQDCCWWLKKQD